MWDTGNLFDPRCVTQTFPFDVTRFRNVSSGLACTPCLLPVSSTSYGGGTECGCFGTGSSITDRPFGGEAFCVSIPEMVLTYTTNTIQTAPPPFGTVCYGCSFAYPIKPVRVTFTGAEYDITFGCCRSPYYYGTLSSSYTENINDLTGGVSRTNYWRETSCVTAYNYTNFMGGAAIELSPIRAGVLIYFAEAQSPSSSTRCYGPTHPSSSSSNITTGATVGLLAWYNVSTTCVSDVIILELGAYKAYATSGGTGFPYNYGGTVPDTCQGDLVANGVPFTLTPELPSIIYAYKQIATYSSAYTLNPCNFA